MFITNFNSELKKKQDSLTSTFETGENVFLFAFISLFVSFRGCVYVPFFFDLVTNQTSKKGYLLELIKRCQKFMKRIFHVNVI